MFLIRYDKLTMFFMCFTRMVSFASSYDMTNCTLGILSGNFSPDKTTEFQLNDSGSSHAKSNVQRLKEDQWIV